MKIVIFSIFISCLFADPQEIELFMDWRSDAKGQELFPIGEKETSMLSSIRKKILEKGYDIRSFEKENYWPFLLSFSQIHSWRDFSWWLGLNRPKLSPVCYRVFWSLGPTLKGLNLGALPKETMVLFIWEPPVVQIESHDPKIHACFHKIFTWDDSLVDGIKYFKFYYPVLKPRLESIVPFHEKKFCVMINGRLCSKHPKQLYGEREKVIRFFEDKSGEFDLYGKFWEKRNYKNWKGPVDDKFAALQQYKFCICYENTKDVQGYITEKIFDCFAAGVVPVYLGASNITDYVPKECFIDRRLFANEQELYDFLKTVTEEQYQKYVESSALFLQSDTAKLFSEEHFIKTFIQLLPQ